MCCQWCISRVSPGVTWKCSKQQSLGGVAPFSDTSIWLIWLIWGWVKTYYHHIGGNRHPCAVYFQGTTVLTHSHTIYHIDVYPLVNSHDAAVFFTIWNRFKSTLHEPYFQQRTVTNCQRVVWNFKSLPPNLESYHDGACSALLRFSTPDSPNICPAQKRNIDGAWQRLRSSFIVHEEATPNRYENGKH